MPGLQNLTTTNSFPRHPKTDVDNSFPLPEALTPALINLGVPEKIAERLSRVYIRRANELKTRSEELILATLSKLSSSGNFESFAALQSSLYETYKQKYLSSLAVWSQEACQLASYHIMSQGSSSGAALKNNVDDKKNKKRFKSEYLSLFEFAFSKDRFPSREDKKHLARLSGMSYRQISVWFQNRRCRSGKQSRVSPIPQAPRKDKTRAFECTRPVIGNPIYYQHDKPEDIMLNQRQSNIDSRSIIDLTVSDSYDDEGSYEEMMGSESSSSDDTSSEVIKATPSSESRFPFPASYVSSESIADPFNLKIDSSLWPRRRGLKRSRASERNLRVDDIVSDLESMDVTPPVSFSPHSPRSAKPLPKRSRINMFVSPASPPSPSLTCSSESFICSSDELSLSPVSPTSSYSTIASSLDLHGVCLPATLQYKSKRQYLPGFPIPEAFNRPFEPIGFPLDKNGVEVLSHSGEYPPLEWI